MANNINEFLDMDWNTVKEGSFTEQIPFISDKQDQEPPKEENTEDVIPVFNNADDFSKIFDKQEDTKDKVKDEEKEEKDEIDDEVEDKKIEDAPQDKENADNSSIASPLFEFANFLVEDGVLSSSPEEKEIGEKGLSAIKEHIDKEISERVNKQIESLPEDKEKVLLDKALKKLPEELRNLYENYDPYVPISQLMHLKANELDIKKVNEESLVDNPEMQKNIIAYDMSLKGESQEDIMETLALFEEKELLETRSKKALKSASVYYEKQQEKLIKDAQATKEKTEKEFKDYLESISEIMPGTKMNKKDREQLFKDMTSFKKLDNGRYIDPVREKIMSDPVKYTVNLYILDHLGLLDGKWDKVNLKADSNAASNLEKKIAEMSFPNGNKKSAPKLGGNDLNEFLSKM